MRMVRKNPKSSSKALGRAAAAVIIAALLLCGATGCSGEKGNSWIESPAQEQSVQPSTDEAVGFEGEYDSPRFKSGRYLMTSTAVNKQEYTDSTGQSVYSYSTQTRYTYILDITADEAITCKYTFKDIYATSTEDSSASVDIDTSDLSGRNDSNAVFYDIIGQSFVISADKDCTLTGISGIDDIYSAVPGASQLIDDDTMLNMASDLFFAIPAKFNADTSWQVEQYGITNTYTLSRMSDGMFGVKLAGGESELPEPTTDSSGYTTTYTASEPITGTLLINTQNRAVQELTTNQYSRGTIADADGNGVLFTLTYVTTCTINEA